MRHWNQHYDFEADLIFAKRMTIRGYGVDVAQPGDPVPQEMKDAFGKHRLKTWWDGGFIAIAEPAERKATRENPLEQSRKALSKDAGRTKTPVLTTGTLDGVKHVGGGYYDVTTDGVTIRIRGKKNLPV